MKLVPKEIRNVQYIACMNPSVGTFTIDPRLHRHFLTFAISTPNNEEQEQIFGSWLQRHFENPAFLPTLTNLIPVVVTTTLNLHSKLANLLQPTAIKFLYGFNLRDVASLFKGVFFSLLMCSLTLVTNIFCILSGLLLSTPDGVPTNMSLLRLWAHEAHRVYADRLCEERDIDIFKKVLKETVKKCFDRNSEVIPESCLAALADIDEGAILAYPLIFWHFAKGLDDPSYRQVANTGKMVCTLYEALASYNDNNAAMELVLFEDAASHICRSYLTQCNGQLTIY